MITHTSPLATVPNYVSKQLASKLKHPFITINNKLTLLYLNSFCNFLMTELETPYLRVYSRYHPYFILVEVKTIRMTCKWEVAAFKTELCLQLKKHLFTRNRKKIQALWWEF